MATDDDALCSAVRLTENVYLLTRRLGGKDEELGGVGRGGEEEDEGCGKLSGKNMEDHHVTRSSVAIEVSFRHPFSRFFQSPGQQMTFSRLSSSIQFFVLFIISVSCPLLLLLFLLLLPLLSSSQPSEFYSHMILCLSVCLSLLRRLVLIQSLIPPDDYFSFHMFVFVALLVRSNSLRND